MFLCYDSFPGNWPFKLGYGMASLDSQKSGFLILVTMEASHKAMAAMLHWDTPCLAVLVSRL